jgi:hypothetical protein
MNKRRRHQNRREVVVTPEEDEVVELKIEIPTRLRIQNQTIGKCPPKSNRKKAVGKSTKGKVHQTNLSKPSKVASSNLLNPKFRKLLQKKQIPEVQVTKFQRRRRKQERMTPRRPSNTRSTKHCQT